MNGSNGHRTRLDALEAALTPPDDSERARWQAAWDSAAAVLLVTMAPEHVAGLGEEARECEHPDKSRPWGRLWAEFHGRLVDKVGAAPGVPPRYPDTPLWLGPAHAEVYLAGGPGFSPVGARCPTCGLRLPTAGENVPVVGSGDGWRYEDTDEPAPTPGLPDIASERVMWREVVLLGGCPLCAIPMAIVDEVMKDYQ